MIIRYRHTTENYFRVPPCCFITKNTPVEVVRLYCTNTYYQTHFINPSGRHVDFINGSKQKSAKVV